MKREFACLLVAAVFSGASVGHAIDLQPGEVRAPRPDVNFMQFSYVYSERDDFYVDGHKARTDTALNSAQELVRFGRSFEIGDLPALFYAQVPMGYVHPEKSLSNLEGDAGIGDTALLLAAWPYANRETDTYFGVGMYLVAPTGSYDEDRFFNMGENRYKTALQAGVQTPVVGDLSFMAAFDTVWFGKNDDFRSLRTGTQVELDQHALSTFQTGLRYDFNPQYSLSAVYFYTFGGETEENGRSMDNRTRLQRYQISGIGNFSFGRITLQYGSDIDTENGFFEDSRAIVRYTIVW